MSKYITGILEFLDHFQREGAGGAFQFDLIENLSPDQAEIAIHIPQV